MKKDYTANSKSMFSLIGSSAHSIHERHAEDYYATEPKAIELLLELENFEKVWECATGGGHLAEILQERNLLSKESDVVKRGSRPIEIIDFLDYERKWDGDIITNPPYKFANHFIEKAMNILNAGNKLALFLPVRYLEGKARKKLFALYPPKKVYISSSRLVCAKNGDFETYNASAQAYAWFVWEKGYSGESKLEWFN